MNHLHRPDDCSAARTATGESGHHEPLIDGSRRRTLRQALFPPLVWTLPGITGTAFAQDNAPSTEPLAKANEDPQARRLVQVADEIRLPRESFQVDVRVSSVQQGQPVETRRYRILSKGSDNTIVQTLEPAAERGQNLLLKGRDLWVFMPSVSQPVRLSLSQRLTGQVANGDLARASFSEDYVATIRGNERIDGREHWVLELSAAERAVTYPRIVYWVDAAGGQPRRADFHALSGRLLKSCRYEAFGPLGGKTRPTRLVMTDALKKGDESVLEYSDLKLVALADRLFTKESLKRLD